MSHQKTVIKIGGNEMDDPAFVRGLAEATAVHQREKDCILIHGGGRAISELMQAMQIEPQYKDGQRVTDAATLEIAEMVLSGKINKRLVLALLEAGLDAVGMSGIDRKLLQVEPWGEGMDRVGRIVQVRSELLDEYCDAGVVPVISPISVGPDGRYNVNADHAAGMVAGALQASTVVFISNVPGVLNGSGIISNLSRSQVNSLISEGHISGGMIPKVHAALDALKFGAQRAIITNLTGFKNGTGTSLLNGKEYA